MSVRRFPRRSTPGLLSAIVKLRWSEVTFDVRLSKDGSKTVFLFSVPVPGDIREVDSALYHAVFGKDDAAWLEALSLSYLRTRSGDKTAHYHISHFLERVVRRALRFSMASDWPKDKQHRDMRRKYLKELKSVGSKKRGPQPEPHLAIELELRLRKLESDLREIQLLLRSKSIVMTDKLAQAAIEKYVPYQMVRRALASILGCDLSEVTPFDLRGKRISSRQVAKKLIECELEDKGQPLGHCKIDSYFREGKALLKGLDCLDRSRWPSLLSPPS